MTDALWLPAPAKVNLSLRVIGRRPDGYHELDTVFHSLALADDLVAARTREPGISLEVVSEDGTGGLAVPADADNLVARAAHAWLEAARLPGGFRFFLRKRIPAGGGLGGGSSDAAAALRLMAALSARDAPPLDLAALAVRLGADVPFFLRGGTARGRGVGERLTPIPGAPHLAFVLVIPPFGTSTRAVFENLDARLIDPAEASTLSAVEVPISRDFAMIAEQGNELESAAFRTSPRLVELRDRARAAGIHDLRLSGSGSTLFVARPDRAAADEALALLSAALPDDVRLRRTESAGVLAEPRSVRWPVGRPPELDP